MTDDAWIDTVRVARDLGTVRQLYPPGVTTLLDVPHRLFEAIRFALMVIGWDELEEDERPPKRIWLQPHKLKPWFAEIRRKRRAGAGTGAAPDPWNREIDDPVQNDAARLLVSG